MAASNNSSQNAEEPEGHAAPAPAETSDQLPLETVRRTANSKTSRKQARLIEQLPLKTIGFSVIVIAIAVTAFLFREPIRTRFFADADSEELVNPIDPNSIFGLGRLEPDGEVVSVSAPSGAGEARIQSLDVAEGDLVEPDQPLAVLDNERRLMAAREVANHKVTQAQARLNQTRLTVDSTRSALQASLESARASVKNAQSAYDRQEELYQSSATSEEAVDAARLGLETAQAKLQEIQAQLTRYEADSNGQSVDELVAEEDLAVAKASLDQAIADAEQAYVRSPFAGKVLDIHLREGERIGQSPLLDLGRTDQMMVRVEVYESEVSEVKVGQQVTVKGAPFSEPLVGTVDRVASFVKKQSIVDATPAANTDARVVEVWVKLDEESSSKASNWVDLQVRAEIHK